jgi:hypothetical protein
VERHRQFNDRVESWEGPVTGEHFLYGYAGMSGAEGVYNSAASDGGSSNCGGCLKGGLLRLLNVRQQFLCFLDPRHDYWFLSTEDGSTGLTSLTSIEGPVAFAVAVQVDGAGEKPVRRLTVLPHFQDGVE